MLIEDSEVMMAETPRLQLGDFENKSASGGLGRPQSQKQSARYSTRNESDRNANMLCQSDTSVV